MDLATTNRLPHAILLEGRSGWGLRELAARVTAALLNIDQDPADVVHLDLLWIEPEGPVIRIDEVRELIEFLHQTAQSGLRKVAAIVDAHRLNQYAANALLKILEEPPAEKHLILTTTAPGRLLPTILSRCQRLTVNCAEEAEVRRWLAQTGYDSEEVDRLLIEYGGAPYAVKNAVEDDRAALRQRLIDVWRSPQLLSDVASEFSQLDFDDALARWQRIVLRVAKRQPANRSALEFYDELLESRRQFREVPQINRVLHFEKLLFQWREVRTK